MRLQILIILICLTWNCKAVFGQYQFPNDAISKIKEYTSSYVNSVKNEKYLHFKLQIYKRQENESFETRTTHIYKVDSLVVIETNGARYYIDPKMMVMVNDDDEKLYVKEFLEEEKTDFSLFEDFEQSIDSILTYTSSITYTEKSSDQTKFNIQIDPENYYLFDNLMFQEVYYSGQKILPDSIVKGYYDVEPFEEVTTYKFVSTKELKQYPYQNSLSYFFDENQKLKLKYQNYSYSKL